MSSSPVYDWLPKSFRNVVVECRDDEESNGFVATVRTSAETRLELAQWLQEFQDFTKTHWAVRRTFPGVQRILHRTDFVCQHSSFNKSPSTKRPSKNCECPAKLTQRVKITSDRTKFKDKFTKDGLPGMIEIHNIHNHPLNTADVLVYLRPTAECRDTFHGYFDNGMVVAEALKYHHNVLLLREDVSEVLLADASINPRQRTVSWWYDQWRAHNHGPRTDSELLNMLEQKIELFCSAGHRIAVHWYPLAIAIVTPIMQRAHSLCHLSQTVFVDSVAGCDVENHSLTLILAPCAAGAVPLGVLITAGQSTHDYALAFSLLKSLMESEGFGGEGCKLTFVTGEMEQAALQENWPDCDTQLREEDSSLERVHSEFTLATIELCKELIISRCKSHSIVTLINFLCSVFEDFTRRRLSAFSRMQAPKPPLILTARPGASPQDADTAAVDEKTYKVCDAHNNEHIVDVSRQTCTCVVAASGHFCQHQQMVWRLTGAPPPKLPPMSAGERRQMAIVALGDDAGPDFEPVLDRLRELHDHFGTTPNDTERLLERLNDIGTAADWHALVQRAADQDEPMTLNHNNLVVIRCQKRKMSTTEPTSAQLQPPKQECLDE